MDDVIKYELHCESGCIEIPADTEGTPGYFRRLLTDAGLEIGPRDFWFKVRGVGA